MNISSLISGADRVIEFWASWMIAMSGQVAGLVVVLAILSYLLRNRSAPQQALKDSLVSLKW